MPILFTVLVPVYAVKLNLKWLEHIAALKNGRIERPVSTRMRCVSEGLVKIHRPQSLVEMRYL